MGPSGLAAQWPIQSKQPIDTCEAVTPFESDPQSPNSTTAARGERRKGAAAAAAGRSMASTAGYLARRAAQKERVRLLYRRALKDTLNWAVHRHLFYQDVSSPISLLPPPSPSRSGSPFPLAGGSDLVLPLPRRRRISGTSSRPTDTW